MEKDAPESSKKTTTVSKEVDDYSHVDKNITEKFDSATDPESKEKIQINELDGENVNEPLPTTAIAQATPKSSELEEEDQIKIEDTKLEEELTSSKLELNKNFPVDNSELEGKDDGTHEISNKRENGTPELENKFADGELELKSKTSDDTFRLADTFPNGTSKIDEQNHGKDEDDGTFETNNKLSNGTPELENKFAAGKLVLKSKISDGAIGLENKSHNGTSKIDGKDDEDEITESKDEETSVPLLVGESVSINMKGDNPTIHVHTGEKKKINFKEIKSPFLNPVRRFRNAWRWILCMGGLPFISIAMFIVGSIYIDDCKVQPNIPVYLTVGGVLGTVQHLIAFWNKCVPESSQGRWSAYRIYYSAIDGAMMLFLLIWFIIGCVWVYGVKDVDFTDPQKDEYCHKSLYYFAFWLLNLSFILIALVAAMSMCLLIFVIVAPEDDKATAEK